MFALGFVAGLGAFTAPPALFLARGSLVGVVLVVLAVAELVGDMLPQIPSVLVEDIVAIALAAFVFTR